MSTDRKDIQVPQKSIGDHGYAAIRAAISAIPIAGGPAVEILAAIVTPPIEKRRNEWMAAVSEALRTLEQEQRIDLASLGSDPQFIDAVLEASRIALRTSRTEKLAALRNAVLNSALRTEPDLTIQEILLNLVDGLTPLHIQFLRRFAGIKGQTTTSTDGFACFFPELKASPLLYRTIGKDLRDRGLIDADALVPTPEKGTITIDVSELGLRLIRFITAPE
jgi:hypothetical protein